MHQAPPRGILALRTGTSLFSAVAKSIRCSCSTRRISRIFFRHRIFAERFALAHALAVVQNRLALVVEVELQHRLGLRRHLDLARNRGRRAAQIIDLPGDGQGVLEFLPGVPFELSRDGHVLRGLERLRRLPAS